MIECREIVDTVKQEAAQDILSDKAAPVEIHNLVIGNDGKVCEVCKDLQTEFGKNPGGLPPKRIGLIIAGLVGGTGLAITTICIPFVLPALRKVCLPYVPATTTQLDNVRRALQGRLTTAPTLVDIGSGDGRIVIQAAKSGYRAHGVELNRWLVYYSRWSALRAGQRGQATFTRQDLWKSDMGKFNNVVIFGVEQMMSQLEHKLEKELVEGSMVVACRFKFPNWKPVEEIGVGVDTVWKYQR